MKMKRELIEYAKKRCIECDVVIELYEEPLDFSQYDPTTFILELCTKSVEGIPDEAVVYHEIAHVEQHHTKYWALMLIIWMDRWIGYYPSFIHYIVERNATDRALATLGEDGTGIWMGTYEYLQNQLDAYKSTYFQIWKS